MLHDVRRDSGMTVWVRVLDQVVQWMVGVRQGLVYNFGDIVMSLEGFGCNTSSTGRTFEGVGHKQPKMVLRVLPSATANFLVCLFPHHIGAAYYVQL